MEMTLRVDHVGMVVPDLERAVHYYQAVLRLEVSERLNDAVYLRCDERHHCLVLYAGQESRLHHLGLEVRNGRLLEQVRRQLLAEGVAVFASDHSESGHPPGICCHDPDGNVFELFTGMEVAERPQTSDVRPLRFGHLAFLASDLGASVRFLEMPIECVFFEGSILVDVRFRLRC